MADHDKTKQVNEWKFYFKFYIADGIIVDKVKAV